MNAGKSLTTTPGSIHSPQWKPVSHRYRSEAAAAANRTQAVIAPHISRSSDVSPYAWYRSQGADTTTSPQPAEPCRAPSGPSKPSAGGHGDMLATQPSARWSSTTSPSHLRVKARTSYRYAAVVAETCQSPVQPARSRCGQSVGMSQMFDRSDHTTASCSRLTRSSLQPNQPSLRRSEWTTTPVMSSGPSGPW